MWDNPGCAQDWGKVMVCSNNRGKISSFKPYNDLILFILYFLVRGYLLMSFLHFFFFIYFFFHDTPENSWRSSPFSHGLGVFTQGFLELLTILRALLSFIDFYQQWCTLVICSRGLKFKVWPRFVLKEISTMAKGFFILSTWNVFHVAHRPEHDGANFSNLKIQADMEIHRKKSIERFLLVLYQIQKSLLFFSYCLSSSLAAREFWNQRISYQIWGSDRFWRGKEELIPMKVPVWFHIRHRQSNQWNSSSAQIML